MQIEVGVIFTADKQQSYIVALVYQFQSVLSSMELVSFHQFIDLLEGVF